MHLEPIEFVLKKAGSILVFPLTEIYAIPVFEFQILYKGEDSPYEVERQNFSFQTSTNTLFEENIVEGDTFTLTDEIYNYSFEIERIVPDMTGWSEMYCIHTGKENV